MNKIILPVAIVAVAIVAVGLYFAGFQSNAPKEGSRDFAQKTADNPQNQGQPQSQGTESISPSGSYTINELRGMNKPMECTWSESATEKNSVTNTLYINGNKFYQDVAMGDIGHAYTISDGEYLYIWSDFNNAASKMKFSEIKTGAASAQTPGQNDAALEQKRDFVCKNWAVDNSVFNPPQDKNFKDITQELGGAIQDFQQNSAEYKQQTCDMCRKAPSQELIDQCLQSMQCQ